MKVEPINVELVYCNHVSCRLDAANELCWMGQVLGRDDLLRCAREAMSAATVRCRRQPRKGPIHAPLP